MDPSSQFIVPTIIDVPELIVTNEDLDFDDAPALSGSLLFSNLQFLSSAISYTISLGTVWRFPEFCYKHGGGAYLLAYTLALILVGLPLFLLELAFGQYANEGPITIWRLSPAFEGIGYAMCLISAMIAVYYNYINAWIIQYLYASITWGQLPWSSCDNSWNRDGCFLRPDKPLIVAPHCQNNTSLQPINQSMTSTSTTISPDNQSQLANNSSLLLVATCASESGQNFSQGFERIINSTSDQVTLPADEFFHNNILAISSSLDDWGPLNWSLVFSLILAWSLVFIIIFKDLRLSSWQSMFALLMPYLCLIALLARALSLDGASEGVTYYLTAQWWRLSGIDIWADAITQLFFALSPCWGGIITLASANKFHNNFHSDTLLLAAINYITSVLVGLASFATLGYMSSYSGIAIDEVADVGIGFVFMVYTEALAKLPLPNLNSTIFFGSLLVIGLSNQLTLMDSVMTTIVDTWPHKLRYRKPLILVILCTLLFSCSLVMCFGNGFYLLQLVDQFAGTFNAMIVGILELLAIAWVYGIENFIQDIDDMISVHRGLFPSRTYWQFMWRYLSPSILFAVLLFSVTDLQPLSYRKVVYPDWTMRLGWTLTFCSVLIIPAIAFLRLLQSPSGSLIDKLSFLCRPSEDWAPSSYVTGPKLLGRHMMLSSQGGGSHERNHRSSCSPSCDSQSYEDQDQESQESNEDFKVVDGRANYIIPEEDEDDDEQDAGATLITNETNL